MTTQTRKWLLLGASLFFALALPVRGEPGDLDLTFNGTGKAVADAAGGAVAVAVQPDGKIVLAGDQGGGLGKYIVVARFNPDGTVDSSFNGTGSVTVAGSGGYSFACRILVQPDGKLLVYGGADNRTILVRLMPDGSLDLGFGNSGEVRLANSHTGGMPEALQSDGKIIVASENWAYFGGEYGASLLVARYTQAGVLDTSFNGSGMVETRIFASPGGFVMPYSIAVQPDGRILVGGETSSCLAFVVRYRSDGSIDTTFNGTGVFVSEFVGGAARITVLSDGQILVASCGSMSGEGFSVFRLTPSGALDTTFNGSGILTETGAVAYDLAVQSDGRFIVARWMVSGFDPIWLSPRRYYPNGAVDTTFVEMAAPNFTWHSSFSEMALLPSGMFLVAGESVPEHKLAVVRYLGGATAGTARFSAPIYVVSEKALSAVVTVQRINAYSGTLVVDYEVGDGTASSGLDYVAASGTLTFGPGQRAKTIRIALLPDQIADGAETVKLTLTSSSGHLLDSATVVLRESSLALSSRKLRPGQRITVLGKFDPTQPLHVRFTDHELNDTRVRASDVTARSAKVRVPVMLDAAFEPAAAVVTVQAEQGTIVAGPVPKVSVASPALTGQTAGAFTLEFLKVTKETLLAAMRNWEAIDNQSEGAVDSSAMRADLDNMLMVLSDMELTLQDVVDGTTDHIDLGTIGSEMVSLGSDGLATLDRMLVAAVFEGKFTPATAGGLRLRRLAESLAPAAAVTPDPIGDFHDEQNPTLAQTMAGIFGMVTKCSETATTYVGKAAELVKEYIPESAPLVESAEETFAAVNYYAAVVAPAVMGNATLAMSAPFIELELGKPVDVLEASKPGFEHLEQGSKAFLEEHKDVLIAKLEAVLAGRGGTLLDFVKRFDDLTDNVSKAIELEDEYSVIEQAYAAVNSIYNNRPKPVVSIDDVSVTEPATGTRNAAFLVSLDRVFDAPVTVSFGTTAGSAGTGDFTPRSGSVTIAKGSRATFITVAVRADAVTETPETFSVNLTAASNATLGKSVGTCTILDAKRAWSISGSITVESYGTYSLSESFALPRSGGVRSYSLAGVATVKITVTASTMSVNISGFKVTSEGSGSGRASGSAPIIDHTTSVTAAGPISGNVHVVFSDGTACDFAVTGSFSATGSK